MRTGLCLIVLVLQLFLVRQSPAQDVQELLGAESFLNEDGIVIGLSIPGFHTGFHPDVSIPERFHGDFDTTRPHAKNDPLRVAFWSAEDLAVIQQFSELRWLRYCGSTSKFLPRETLLERELDNLTQLESTTRVCKALTAIAIFDSALTPQLLVSLMSKSSVETILLTDCFIQSEGGAFTRIPNATMTFTR